MGSCISKCKPKKKSKQPLSPVQDKLVISQDPVSPVPKKMTTMPFENPNPLPSSSCSTNTAKFTTTSSSSSSSSASSGYCSSSVFIAKDRSFSNEFLRSCVKDNHHLITLKPKAANEKDQRSPKIQYPRNIDMGPLVKTKLPALEKEVSRVPTPKKRARTSSPILIRQKSFRKEQTFNYVPNRALRSPSPSRRFSNNGPRVNDVVNSCPRRESFRAPQVSPNRVGPDFWLVKKDGVVSRRASAKIKDQEMDVVMEDINNPHIALDCFIFL